MMAAKQRARTLCHMAQVKRLGMLLLSQGATQADVARELGVSRTSASNWAAALGHDSCAGGWRPAHGPAASLAPTLSAENLERLDGMLRLGAGSFGFPSEAWTMARVAVLLECEFGVVCSNMHVWGMLGGAPTRDGIRRHRLVEPADAQAAFSDGRCGAARVAGQQYAGRDLLARHGR